MESSSLLRGEQSSRSPRLGFAARLAVAALACVTATAGVVAWRSSSSTASSGSTTSSTDQTAELYSKKDLYGPDYGALVGGAGSAMQKAWPGLTCDRSDDDKWDWGKDPMHQPLDSGTNCVYGDTGFCMTHYMLCNSTNCTDTSLMATVSELMWNKCNSSCNATDEGREAAVGVDARLVGSSGLAACEFQGVTDMEEVCTGIPSVFVDESRRRYLKAAAEVPERRRKLREQRRLSHGNVAPSVPERWMTNVLINNTWNNEGCNSHGLCGMCVNSTTNEMNTYCEAFYLYYGGRSEIWNNGYIAKLFWFNVHFWCMSEVLDSIANGTFIAKVDAGLIPSYDEIETAWSNEDAVEYWGTWHITTNDDFPLA